MRQLKQLVVQTMVGMTVTTGSKNSPPITIFTREHDLHAYAVRHALISRGIGCSIIETDGLAVLGGMSWSPAGEISKATINDIDNNQVFLEDTRLLWWRRLTGKPRFPESLIDEDARDLVANDCRATLLGLAITQFKGLWISHPEATRVAENKLVQLTVAQKVGLRIPRTLISQDPITVRKFCAQLDFQVVVKTVAGTHKTPVMAGRITQEMLTDEAISLCPAIYQEMIQGINHLRVCCFGNQVHTALLKTDQLDWRYPLNVSAEPFELDENLKAKLFNILTDLNLEMGVMDMKLTPEGEPVWLEVNPQGQFLFLEGLCGMPLTNIFTEFLISKL